MRTGDYKSNSMHLSTFSDFEKIVTKIRKLLSSGDLLTVFLFFNCVKCLVYLAAAIFAFDSNMFCNLLLIEVLIEAVFRKCSTLSTLTHSLSECSTLSTFDSRRVDE
jgi:hypothetical protein